MRITTIGADGSATGSASVPVPTPSRLLGIAVNYSGSQPATTDVTVKCVDPTGLTKTLLTITDSNTDLPLSDVVNDPLDNAGAAETAAPVHPLVAGQVTVDVAGANGGESVDVFLAIAAVRP